MTGVNLDVEATREQRYPKFDPGTPSTIRLGAICCSRRWAGVLRIEAGNRYVDANSNKANVPCVSAVDLVNESDSAARLRGAVNDLVSTGVNCVLVLCDGYANRSRSERLFIVEDHVNWTGDNPLIGIRDSEHGVPFLDMSAPYDHSIQTVLHRAAIKAGVAVTKGVAIDAPPERLYAMSDPVTVAHGMVTSLAHPVIAARHAGLTVGAVAWLQVEPDSTVGTETAAKGLEFKDLSDFWKSAVELLAADSGVL